MISNKVFLVPLYIRTFVIGLIATYRNSKTLKRQGVIKNRLLTYFDLLYWRILYGFDFTNYCSFRFWNKNVTERKNYISTRRNSKLSKMLSTPEVYEIFLNKVKFNERFADYVRRNWIDLSNTSVGEFSNFAQNNMPIIVKPSEDYGGHGIQKINNLKDIEELIREKIKDDNGAPGTIAERCIENVDSIRRLAPGSLNTIRIVTLIDKNSKLHILASLLRMGNGESFTDNYFSGGMACPIDPTTGKLIKKAYGMGFVEYTEHPYSGVTFEGYNVEGYKKCLELVRKIAFVEPDARMVGWDFAVTDDGIELLEGNIPPGENILQIAAGRGLWNDILQMI